MSWFKAIFLTLLIVSGRSFCLKVLRNAPPIGHRQVYCHFCEDLTSDYADISVGSIGSGDGWSSVITRSKEADDLYNKAVKAKLIESKNLKEVKPGQFLVEKIGGIKRNKCKPIELKKHEQDSE